MKQQHHSSLLNIGMANSKIDSVHLSNCNSNACWFYLCTLWVKQTHCVLQCIHESHQHHPLSPAAARSRKLYFRGLDANTGNVKQTSYTPNIIGSNFTITDTFTIQTPISCHQCESHRLNPNGHNAFFSFLGVFLYYHKSFSLSSQSLWNLNGCSKE